jgi:hypothetical protein
MSRPTGDIAETVIGPAIVWTDLVGKVVEIAEGVYANPPDGSGPLCGRVVAVYVSKSDVVGLIVAILDHERWRAMYPAGTLSHWYAHNVRLRAPQPAPEG